jgi:hypothetical protein
MSLNQVTNPLSKLPLYAKSVDVPVTVLTSTDIRAFANVADYNVTPTPPAGANGATLTLVRGYAVKYGKLLFLTLSARVTVVAAGVGQQLTIGLTNDAATKLGFKSKAGDLTQIFRATTAGAILAGEFGQADPDVLLFEDVAGQAYFKLKWGKGAGTADVACVPNGNHTMAFAVTMTIETE